MIDNYLIILWWWKMSTDFSHQWHRQWPCKIVMLKWQEALNAWIEYDPIIAETQLLTVHVWKTRQSRTPAFWNASAPSRVGLLPRMFGGPKFDPLREVKLAPKREKSTDRDQNLINFEGQNTLACRISGHSSHAFFRKCPETLNLTSFTKLK